LFYLGIGQQEIGVASYAKSEIIPIEPDADNAGVGKDMATAMNPSWRFPAERVFLWAGGQ